MNPLSTESAPSGVAGRMCLPILQATILGTALIFSLQLRSFLDVKEAVLWLGVLGLWATCRSAGHPSTEGFRALLPGWVTLAGTALIGAACGGAPALSLLEGLRLAALLAAATLAWDHLQQPEAVSSLLRAIVLAGTLAAALALAQWGGLVPGLFPAFPHFDQDLYSVFGNQGLLAGYLAVALVALPGALDPKRHRTLYLLAGLLMLAALLLTGSRGGILAFVAGMTIRAILEPGARRECLLLLAAIALLAIALAFSFVPPPWARWFEVGAGPRPWIWRATAALAFEQFPWGAGLGHYSRAIPVHLGQAAATSGGGFNELVTEHAHFDLLEWFAETGVPGLAGLLWFVWRVRPSRPAAFSALLTGLIFSCFHPALQSAPHALVGLLLVVACQTPHRVRGSSRPATGPSRTAHAGLPLVIGAVAFFTLEFYPSWLLARAEALHLRGAYAREAYERAINAPGFHPEAHESFGILLYEQGDPVGALNAFERARAGLDSGRLYRLLGMAAEKAGDREAACRWYRECATRWPWNPQVKDRITALCPP